MLMQKIPHILFFSNFLCYTEYTAHKMGNARRQFRCTEPTGEVFYEQY